MPLLFSAWKYVISLTRWIFLNGNGACACARTHKSFQMKWFFLSWWSFIPNQSHMRIAKYVLLIRRHDSVSGLSNPPPGSHPTERQSLLLVIKNEIFSQASNGRGLAGGAVFRSDDLGDQEQGKGDVSTSFPVSPTKVLKIRCSVVTHSTCLAGKTRLQGCDPLRQVGLWRRHLVLGCSGSSSVPVHSPLMADQTLRSFHWGSMLWKKVAIPAPTSKVVEVGVESGDPPPFQPSFSQFSQSFPLCFFFLNEGWRWWCYGPHGTHSPRPVLQGTCWNPSFPS